MARLNTEKYKGVATIDDGHDVQLFVVDMINGFCKKGLMADKKIMDIVPYLTTICELIPAEQTIFIRDCHNEDDVEFLSFPQHCLKDTWESEVIDELKPFSTKALEVKKNSTNAFHSLLNQDNIFANTLIITGCCTDICVLQFALTLKTYFNSINSNKRVIIPYPGVDTYHSSTHDAYERNEWALTLLQEAGIEIVNAFVIQMVKE